MFVFTDINLPSPISLFPILHACMYVQTLYIIDVINLNKYFDIPRDTTISQPPTARSI